jgi:predicted nucleic acid-binding Zn ribbon protein
MSKRYRKTREKFRGSCINCGKKDIGDKYFCSAKCKRELSEIPPGPCAECYKPAPKNKLWCSLECQVAGERRKTERENILAVWKDQDKKGGRK